MGEGKAGWLSSAFAAMTIDDLVARAQRALAADRYALYRWRQETSYCVRREGVSEQFVEAIRRSDAHRALLDQLRREQPAVLTEPISPQQRMAWEGEGIAGAVLLPLSHDQKLQGLLAFYYDQPRRIEPPGTPALALARVLGWLLDEHRPDDWMRPRDAGDRIEAILCHDLEAPLDSTQTLIDRARRQLALAHAADDPEVLHTLEQAQRQIEDLSARVSHLRQLVEGEDQEMALALAPVAINDELPPMIERLSDLTAGQAIDLTVSIEADLPGVCCRADPARLEQALGNVVLNAAERSAPRSTIRITLATVRPAGRAAAAVISVHDTGPPPGRELAAAGVGSGIHLYFARQLVERQGGSLSIACPHDGGMTVSFELPLLEHGRASIRDASATS
jgi:signal transduction histidine kinase